MARIPKAVSYNDDIHDLVIKTFRCYVLDLVEQYGGGHPGSAMGMVAIGIALWKYQMKYAPNDPDYFNRDRFVLSNGHVCLFQYLFQHLTGLKEMTVKQLQSYHSSDYHSLTPGHPEIENPAVEVTTGPLGQGISNAVGMAIGSKNLAATYNRPGFPVVDNTIYAIVGDACLQEGPALESISLAGHLALDNLIVIYDNNQVCCDGSVDVNNTEDISAKFRAQNWNVIEVENGSRDVATLVKAIEWAKAENERPTLINVRTEIGQDSAFGNHHAAHGSALGEEGIRELKAKYGFDVARKFWFPQEVYDFFAEKPAEGDQLVANWKKLLDEYVKNYPQEGEELKARIRGELPKNWKSFIPQDKPTEPTATRTSAREIVRSLGQNLPQVIAGSGDLSVSILLNWGGVKYFFNPKLQTFCGLGGDYSGRYIEFGIREHSMCAIANGLAAYNKGTFLPITSTFYMFYLYAAPALRMAALQELKAIHIATHDSIGAGEDGPTHQPIALSSLFRAMPNFYYIRPADATEVAALFEVAVELEHSTLFSLSRHEVEQYPGKTSAEGAKRGGYVVEDCEGKPDVQLIGAGSELEFAVKTARLLRQQKGWKVRVLSFPCQRLFDQQSLAYRRSVLRRGEVPTVVVEAYVAYGWERYATAGYTMNTFGKSLPVEDVYKYFGYTPEKIGEKVAAYVNSIKASPQILYEFTDLKGKPKHDKL
ncbi:Transketolase, similar to Tkl2p [Komagataella phaffii GS115]|uniref:Dihydroxyacetone synthase n=1 Tax=Komagataella phaffii (strain GS115 / ATCC 20864) TaxID=644223 RepID=C4R5Q0_KOMPG|nr:Transketolase, similar to Tkl2p [Komagataella phaffii GS115]CAY70886.1 Transketolase, similar to Tkl2p [Komagataella phaffii GS115]